MSKDVKKVDMTMEDQTNINAFNKLNSQMHEVEAQISVKKKLLEELEDASNELMLCDEEEVRYVLGECFVYMDKDSAEERLQSTTDLLKKEASDHNLELQGIKEQMQKLKAALYGKFGRNINLEE